MPSTMTQLLIVQLVVKQQSIQKYHYSHGTYYHPKSVMIFKDIIDEIPDREYLVAIPEIISVD